ncbi:FliI/YscN family ATPase [Rhizobium paknamense]|uniref:Type III secretion protein N (ATPase) n=1 Tax=Rhizobium paknamense TaxID=1206817 RepID=A0ABU0IDZ1_9HYPH|nr:FliI/YscN family ATPase [Rhizobium paknamense]MDQ0456386.1 type III secretion protein N (ATPase) [Rhizobium paknamense]
MPDRPFEDFAAEARNSGAATLQRWRARLDDLAPVRESGRVMRVTGPLVQAIMPSVAIGELCELREPGQGLIGLGEVVGIEGEHAVLSLHGDTRGLSQRTEVTPTGQSPAIAVGDFLLGAVIDAHGRMIAAPSRPVAGAGERIMQPLHGHPPPPLKKLEIEQPFVTGIRAIDGLLTCGEGQRLGIFGPPGAGKSTLISDIVHGSNADVVVCALVGERGREVGEFVRAVMPDGAASKVVLVVATSDRPSLERYKAVLTALSVGEYFRDRGRRVLLVVDSVTRVARALREIGLAAGEPPVRRGYPPSVFAALPKLFERSGNSEKGRMTAFYTVLVEGEDQDDPIAEETRSLLDGHIILSDKIAQAGLFPAIDVLMSRSRTMNAVVTPQHRAAAEAIRSMLALYREVELLIRVGEYQPGRDAAVDKAVAKRPQILDFLHASARQHEDLPAVVAHLEALGR